MDLCLNYPGAEELFSNLLEQEIVRLLSTTAILPLLGKKNLSVNKTSTGEVLRGKERIQVLVTSLETETVPEPHLL